MDRLKELLSGNEFVNSNCLQTALGIPPAKFIKMINEFDIPYYSDKPCVLCEETAEISGGGIVDHQPSQSPVDISMLGGFKFHEGDLREAARTIEAFYPLLEEVSGNQDNEGIDSNAQLIAENARLREALKALANGIVGESRDDSGERSQSVLGALAVGVETDGADRGKTTEKVSSDADTNGDETGQAAPMEGGEAELKVKPEVRVLVTLFDGKTPQAARDALRHSDYAEHIIAYVLTEFMGINVTEVGRLLKDRMKDGLAPSDSTALRHAHKLLKNAAEFAIVRG